MISQKIEVGILASSPEVMESLAGHLEATQLAEVKLKVTKYCEVEDDYATHQFLESQPEVILVDMREERAAIKIQKVLCERGIEHLLLPEDHALQYDGSVIGPFLLFSIPTQACLDVIQPYLLWG